MGVLEEELEKEGVCFADVAGAGANAWETGEMESVEGDNVGGTGINAQDTGEDVEGDDVGLTGADTAWEIGGEMESMETKEDVEGDDVCMYICILMLCCLQTTYLLHGIEVI